MRAQHVRSLAEKSNIALSFWCLYAILSTALEIFGERMMSLSKRDGDYHRAKLEILFTSARQESSPFEAISIVCIGEPLPPMDFALLIVM